MGRNCTFIYLQPKNQTGFSLLESYLCLFDFEIGFQFFPVRHTDGYHSLGMIKSILHYESIRFVPIDNSKTTKNNKTDLAISLTHHHTHWPTHKQDTRLPTHTDTPSHTPDRWRLPLRHLRPRPGSSEAQGSAGPVYLSWFNEDSILGREKTNAFMGIRLSFKDIIQQPNASIVCISK